MQSVIQGEYFLMDRTLKSVSFLNTSMCKSTTCIYEVIRVTHAKPLFWNDHLERLANSIKIAGFEPSIKLTGLLPKIKMLISTNAIQDGNIKLEFRYLSNGERQFMAYFTPTNYPNKEQEIDGIQCSFQFSERHHPTAKIYNAEVRGKANTIIEQREVYETILVNHDNCLTEGSRSNLFFIKDDALITAEDTIVLPGIIRKQILSIAKDEGISVYFRAVAMDEIDQMEAAFITGTSPRILPIALLGKVTFKVDHPLFIRLKQLFNNRIKEQY